jgi:chromosome segregation ATPase
MSQQEPVPENVSEYQWNPNDLREELSRVDDFTKAIQSQLSSASLNVNILHENIKRAVGPIPSYVDYWGKHLGWLNTQRTQEHENYQRAQDSLTEEKKSYERTLHSLLEEHEVNTKLRVQLGSQRQQINSLQLAVDELDKLNGTLGQEKKELNETVDELKRKLEDGSSDDTRVDRSAVRADVESQAKLEAENMDLAKKLQETRDSVIAREVELEELRGQSGRKKRKCVKD